MPARNHASEWLDLNQADHEGPFSKRSLWAFISSGRLPAYQPSPRKTLIKRADLNRLIEVSRIGSKLDQLVDDVLADLSPRK